MQDYLDQIADIIANPTSNLVAAALLLAAVTLIVLILILVVLIFLMPAQQAAENDEDSAEEPARRSQRTRAPQKALPRNVQIGLFAGITLITIATAYGVTSTNDYCANTCHVMAPSVASWNAAAHSDVSCIRCHEGRLVLSIPVATASRLRQLSAELAGRAPASAVVPSKTCMSCHADQLKGSIETSAGIRVSHAEPLEAGLSCDTCHMAVAHERETASRSTIMTQCLSCHDGATASAECSTCHVGDPGDSPIYDRIYTTTELPRPTCGGCHSEESCDECHGTRMPHTQAFVDGEHARDSGFQRKEMCWNCHVKAECFACHGDFDHSHPPDFFEAHKSVSRQATCSTCHRHHDGPFCDRCH